MSGGVQTKSTAAAFDVVVLAASAGGIGAVSAIVAALPDGFPVPLVVVQHRASVRGGRNDALAEILRRRGRVDVREVVTGDPVAAAGIALTPAGCDTVVDDHGRFVVTPGDGSRHRPADHLLTSVAATYGDRAIAVVLTGRLDDGAAGAQAIKRRGGARHRRGPSHRDRARHAGRCPGDRMRRLRAARPTHRAGARDARARTRRRRSPASRRAAVGHPLTGDDHSDRHANRRG